VKFWIKVKFRGLFLRGQLQVVGGRAMKREYRLSIIYDPSREEVESISEGDSLLEETWFDIGDELLEVPEYILELLESDILGIA
jgi:hypothetical protein